MAEEKVSNQGKRKLYYISAEFLIGKLLSNNLINLGIYEDVKKLLADNGKSLADITSFEGETETTIMFQYGKDFFNGDIVQIANEYGHETKARILEIVRSEDKDGYSVYPTFKTIEQEGA